MEAPRYAHPVKLKSLSGSLLETASSNPTAPRLVLQYLEITENNRKVPASVGAKQVYDILRKPEAAKDGGHGAKVFYGKLHVQPLFARKVGRTRSYSDQTFWRDGRWPVPQTAVENFRPILIMKGIVCICRVPYVKAQQLELSGDSPRWLLKHSGISSRLTLFRSQCSVVAP